MKRFRTPLILLSIIFILAGVAYWDEHKTKQEQGQQDQLLRLILATPEQVVGFSFANKSEANATPDLVFEKRDEGWYLREPIISRADDSAVHALLQTVLSYQYQRKLDEDDLGDLAAYGFDEPRRLIILALEDGTSKRFEVGNNLPVGYSSYVRVDEGPVYVGSQHIAVSLNKSLFDLRSKSLNIPRSRDLSQIEFENSQGERITFVRTENDWMIQGPQTLKADRDEIDDLLQGLRRAQIREFLDDPSMAIRQALSLSNAGTEKLGEISFFDQNGALSQLLLIENADVVYAQWNGDLKFKRMEAGIAELFQKDMWEFQFRDVFSFDSNQVARVSIDGEEFEKRFHNWYRSADPDSPTFYDHIRRFLVDLEFVKAQDMLDEQTFGKERLEEPLHLVRIQLENGSETTAEIWSLEDRVIIKKADDPVYYVVGHEILRELIRSPKTDEDDILPEI